MGVPPPPPRVPTSTALPRLPANRCSPINRTQAIRHLIGEDFPSMNIAPEPSTDVFQVVMAGNEERTVKGAALCIVDELPFAGLGKFGAPFLSKFQVCVCTCKRIPCNAIRFRTCCEEKWTRPWQIPPYDNGGRGRAGGGNMLGFLSSLGPKRYGLRPPQISVNGSLYHLLACALRVKMALLTCGDPT